MKKKRSNIYLIFVLPISFDESDMEYSDALEWAYCNILHDCVVSLDLDDVYVLEEKVLDIVNDVNDSMIGPYEDGWISSQEVKKVIEKKLVVYEKTINKNREKEMVKDILRLLKIAIDTHHNLYFKF